MCGSLVRGERIAISVLAVEVQERGLLVADLGAGPRWQRCPVRSMPKDDLIEFHFGWGMGIRNAFGLWGGNEALLQSCAEARGYPFIHPDDASMVIIEAVWERLNIRG